MKFKKDLHEIDFDICRNHPDAVREYAENWPKIKEVFSDGWVYDFWEPNRFFNRIFYEALVSTPNSEKMSILDFGAYDGFLVRLLRERGLLAFGYESKPAASLYKAIGVDEWINTGRPMCDIVLAFSIAHEYPVAEFLDIVASINGRVPYEIFLDREPTRVSSHALEYFDDRRLSEFGIEVFPATKYHTERSRADLLIWRRGA